MRIGIDARFYGGGFGKGLGRYTERLIGSLEEIDTENEYVIFLRQENWNIYRPRNARFRKVVAPYRWYTLKEQVGMPRLIARERLDLTHFPHFNVPLAVATPFVVTIHDLIITRYPTLRASSLGPLAYAFKQFGYRVVIRTAVRRARRILTVSHFTKNDIRRTFSVGEGKVVVTYEGVDTPSRTTPAPGDLRILRRLGIPTPYLLYVGNAYPHKNLERLLVGFGEFREESAAEAVSLVLVGKEDYFYRRIRDTARALGLAQSVHFPGSVTDKELAFLYAHARLFVFPSLYEGFGLPPLEAMAHGTPVIAARASSLPEILGDAALYVDPLDPHDIARMIRKVFAGEELAKTLGEKGRAWIDRYSWRECARQTRAVYLDAAGPSHQ